MSSGELRDLRVAEVVEQETDLADGGTVRVKLSVSSTYHREERPSSD